MGAYWLEERREKIINRNAFTGRNTKLPKDTIPSIIYDSWGAENKCQSSWEWNSIGRHIKWPLHRLCGTPLNDAIMISTANV